MFFFLESSDDDFHCYLNMPSLSHPESSRPQCFHQVYLVIACEWEFLRFVARWVAPNRGGREKKAAEGGGYLLMVWLVGSNPLVVSVAGSEPYLFFLFWIFFPEGTNIKNTSQKICRIFLYFQNNDNSFVPSFFEWIHSVRGRWVATVEKDQPVSRYQGGYTNPANER